MIIIGYQGIGKSTLCENDYSCIDLESSLFRWHGGERVSGWEYIYAHIAMSLSEQGYDVFISSHKGVREALRSHGGTKILAVVPAIKLDTEWIDKLKNRYDSTNNPKDRAAYLNAKDRYVDNILELEDDAKQFDFELKIIDSMDYNLRDIIYG